MENKGFMVRLLLRGEIRSLCYRLRPGTKPMGLGFARKEGSEAYSNIMKRKEEEPVRVGIGFKTSPFTGTGGLDG